MVGFCLVENAPYVVRLIKMRINITYVVCISISCSVTRGRDCSRWDYPVLCHVWPVTCHLSPVTRWPFTKTQSGIPHKLKVPFHTNSKWPSRKTPCGLQHKFQVALYNNSGFSFTQTQNGLPHKLKVPFHTNSKLP